MPGDFRPRHQERTALHRVLFHHFERFVAEYEERFERTYGNFRPILALERLTLLEAEEKVSYWYGEKGAELEMMDYLEFIARGTSYIPDKGQVTTVSGLPVGRGRPGFSAELLALRPLRCPLTEKSLTEWAGNGERVKGLSPRHRRRSL